MSITLSSASLPVFRNALTHLHHLLEKARADATARGYDPQADAMAPEDQIQTFKRMLGFIAAEVREQLLPQTTPKLAGYEVGHLHIASPQLGNDITALVHDLRTISRAVAEGPGTMHMLLSDPGTAARIEHTLSSVEATASRLAATSAEVDAL